MGVIWLWVYDIQLCFVVAGPRFVPSSRIIELPSRASMRSFGFSFGSTDSFYLEVFVKDFFSFCSIDWDCSAFDLVFLFYEWSFFLNS